MLRNEIQKKTGLTRKAIAYYEEKGLISHQNKKHPYKDALRLDIFFKSSFYRRSSLFFIFSFNTNDNCVTLF